MNLPERMARVTQVTILTLTLTVALGSGSNGCRRSPPPVLFPTDAGRPSRTTDATDHLAQRPTTTTVGTDAGRSTTTYSSLVPGDGTTFALDGVSVHAPPGERFTRYVAMDIDGDGDRDAVVARTRAQGPTVSLLRREPAGFTDVPIAGNVSPSDPRCRDVDLHSTSPRSVVVSFTCDPGQGTETVNSVSDGSAPPSVVREHLVIRLVPEPAVTLDVAQLFPTPRNTVLDTTVDAVDRDGDGRDDVVVTLMARRPNERSDLAVRASVVLMDRPGGYARDTSEPEGSFVRLASMARAWVRRRPMDVLAMVDRVVRLRRALCLESGAARVRIGHQVGVPCAGSSGLSSIAETLARAYVTLGEYPSAWALTRPDSASELGVVSSERWFAELRRATPQEPGIVARAGPFIAQALEASLQVRASALVLAPAVAPTTVLLRGPVTARIDLATLTATPGEPGSLLDVLTRAPDGSLALQGFYQTCDGIVVALCPAHALECTSVPPQPGTLPPGAITVRLTDLPSADHAARCLQNDGAVEPVLRSVDVRALGFGREGLLVLYQGRLFRVVPGAGLATPLGVGAPLGGPFPAGSSVSESGEYAVVASTEGLFVRDPAGRWRLWSAPALVGRYRQLTDLTIANDGRTVVGLLGGQLWVLQRTETAETTSTHR